MKTILIFGSKGMLGYAAVLYFRAQGYRVIELSRENFDIVKDPFSKAVQNLSQADLILNAACIIKSRFANFSTEEIFQVNAIFPRNLAKYSKQNNIPCFNITSDGVFSGNAGPYSEKSYFDSFDLYSISKVAGECDDCMYLRTSIVGEETGEGRSLLEWVRSNQGKEINGFVNHFWNGVTSLFLAEIIDNIFKNNLYQNGVFHIFSKEAVTKYQLLSLINETYNLGIKVNPVEAEVACDRRLVSEYELNQLVSNKSIEQQLKEMRDFFM